MESPARAMRVLAVLAVTSFPAAAQERVTVTGCTEPGVTATCLMLRGDDGNIYNITTARPRPDIGRMVRLTGTRVLRFGICMQGIDLAGIQWSDLGRPCAK